MSNITTKLAIHDLNQNKWVWLSVSLVTFTTSIIVSWCLGFFVSINRVPKEFSKAEPAAKEYLANFSSQILFFSAITAIFIVAVILNNVTNNTAESQALWRLGGATPRQIKNLLLYQTILACSFGTIISTVISLLFQGKINNLIIHLGDSPFENLPPVYSLWTIIGSLAVLNFIAIIAAILPLKRAGKRSPLELRDILQHPVRPSKIYILTLILIFLLYTLPILATSIVTIFSPEVLLQKHPKQKSIPPVLVPSIMSLPLGQALSLVTALCTPWLLSAAISSWTKLFDKHWVSWQLARHMAVTRIATSSATVSPLVFGIGTLATADLSIHTVLKMTNSSADKAIGIIILFAPSAITAATGSIAATIMAARRHKEDLIAMRSATATRRETDNVMFLESLIIILSAALIALIPYAIQLGVLMMTLHQNNLPLINIGFDPTTTLVLIIFTWVCLAISLLTMGRSTWRHPLTELLAEH